MNPGDRIRMKRRDGDRCLSCQRTDTLTLQHRRSRGMGGSKIPLTPADVCTLCLDCNTRAEADLQGKSLRHGWKVRRWAAATTVPVYDAAAKAWFLLGPEWDRTEIAEAGALELVALAGGISGDGTVY